MTFGFVVQYALIVTKGTFLLMGSTVFHNVVCFCFLATIHTHINTHAADELLSHPFSPPPPHFPSTPNPSMAHSASSASGRVAFILSIILSSPSVQFPDCSSFLLGERGKEASKINLYLPLICWLPWHITRRHCCICRANMAN